MWGAGPGRFCGRFSKSPQKLLTKFASLAISGRHKFMTPQRLQIAVNSLLNGPSAGCLVSIFTVRINAKSFPWDVRFVQERYTQIVGNVRCPILRIKTNSTPQCWCGLASDVLKKSRLNWKIKMTNTADNAGITQSQARDTRYRRMQELNSLCVSK